MKTHVHIYHVMSKAEVDIEAVSDKDAASLALCRAKSGKAKFRKSDCDFIAIVPIPSVASTTTTPSGPTTTTKTTKAKKKRSLASGPRKGGIKSIPSTPKPNIKPTGQMPKKRW